MEVKYEIKKSKAFNCIELIYSVYRKQLVEIQNHKQQIFISFFKKMKYKGRVEKMKRSPFNI